VNRNVESGLKSHQRLLTVEEVSRYLAVSVSTVYGWVWQRRIPFVKLGRALRFDLSDLEAFVETNKEHAKSRSLRAGGAAPNAATICGAAGKG